MPTLHLISAGTPTPTPARHGTCYVMRVGEDSLMFDCGPAATHKMVKAGLYPTQVDYLFFTHHHFDHCSDFPCFYLTRWDQGTGREGRLAIYGPPPLEDIVARLVGPDGVYSLDWKSRVAHPHSQALHVKRGGALPRPEPECDVYEVGPGEVARREGWRVSAARASHHQPWLECLSYRVDTDEGAVVITGDTRPCPEVSELSRGADTMVVNTWEHQDIMEETEGEPSIAGTLEAARMAAEAGARTLIVAHTGAHLAAPGSRERGIADMARIFSGRIIFGEELMAVEL